MSRIALDVRRVGGLEEPARFQDERREDVRRVGGLEDQPVDEEAYIQDVRRVGGLEGAGGRGPRVLADVRRVGGLEVQARDHGVHPVRCPPCRRFRRYRTHSAAGDR